jgi:carbonic anhydrase
MFKIIGIVVASTLLAATFTLSLVTWTKTGSMERTLTSQQKTIAAMNARLEESRGDHGGPHGAKAGDYGNHWGYVGEMSPAKWGETFPTCGTGKSQAPIDIRGPFEKVDQTLKLDYQPTPLKVLNNGHTIQVNVAPGSKLTVGGESFTLLQFHFHRPSEELIDGKPSAMTVHFVHKSESGKLAVVGVLLNEGRSNDIIKTIWSAAPAKEGPEVEVAGAALNPSQLLPGKLEYYRYDGSLTTPPCTEGVTFYILKAPLSLGSDQVRAFPFELNARPTMPLNGRKIYSN